VLILGAAPDVPVVGEASDGQEAVAPAVIGRWDAVPEAVGMGFDPDTV
jgi:DNA-binding NarL/FixJ family response regulator